MSDYYTLIAGPCTEGILGMIMEQVFVSNAIDAVLLSSEESLKALGVADATAIAEYYGLRLKTSLYGLSDATEEACRYQEIGWLASAGITIGYSDGTFRPDAEVTRQDMAALLYQLAGSPSFEPTTSDLARFSDVDENTAHLQGDSLACCSGDHDGVRRRHV